LISDKNEAYVLETIDKFYAYKKINDFYNISNKLSIGKDYDGVHPEIKKVVNIEKFYSNKLYTYFSGAKLREKRGRELLQKYDKHNLKTFIEILSDRKERKIASMRNIFMNAGGGLVSSQTTSSMIVEYGNRDIIWFTMSPDPEISLFKPTFFTDENNPLNIKNEQNLIKIWKLNNLFFRRFILNYEDNMDKIKNLKNDYQNKIFDLISKENLKNLTDDELNKITQKSLEIENEYREKGLKLMKNTKKKKYFYFTYYWQKENKKLFEEEKDNELRNLYKNDLL
jgi:secernin